VSDDDQQREAVWRSLGALHGAGNMGLPRRGGRAAVRSAPGSSEPGTVAAPATTVPGGALTGAMDPRTLAAFQREMASRGVDLSL
jgi:hypothetical protein